MRTLAFAFVLAFLIAGGAYSATLAGRVVGVHDGDTITVLDAGKVQHKIRLAAIDAPELKQAFGRRSRLNLSGLVLNKDVAIEWTKRERYKRVVGKVLVDEAGADCAFRSCLKSLDAGLQQIRDGLAWHYKAYAKEQTSEDRARYAVAEIKARETLAGLWADAQPVPPWEWRSAKKHPRITAAQ